MSDGLDNLLEDLSGLNRVIVNADPTPASPDKLKDDLEENKVSENFVKVIVISLFINLNLYLICQFWALLIQQQIKIRCRKYGQTWLQVSD